jgi:hypothetical protein
MSLELVKSKLPMTGRCPVCDVHFVRLKTHAKSCFKEQSVINNFLANFNNNNGKETSLAARTFKKNNNLFELNENVANAENLLFLDDFNISKFESTLPLISSEDDSFLNEGFVASNNKPQLSTAKCFK